MKASQRTKAALAALLAAHPALDKDAVLRLCGSCFMDGETVVRTELGEDPAVVEAEMERRWGVLRGGSP